MPNWHMSEFPICIKPVAFPNNNWIMPKPVWMWRKQIGMRHNKPLLSKHRSADMSQGSMLGETENVKKEAELFRISRMNKMKARVWISEKDVREVERGMPAYAVWNNKRIDGKVVEVDMALDPKTQAFGAVIEFDNPQMILKIWNYCRCFY